MQQHLRYSISPPKPSTWTPLLRANSGQPYLCPMCKSPKHQLIIPKACSGCVAWWEPPGTNPCTNIQAQIHLCSTPNSQHRAPETHCVHELLCYEIMFVPQSYFFFFPCRGWWGNRELVCWKRTWSAGKGLSLRGWDRVTPRPNIKLFTDTSQTHLLLLAEEERTYTCKPFLQAGMWSKSQFARVHHSERFRLLWSRVLFYVLHCLSLNCFSVCNH